MGGIFGKVASAEANRARALECAAPQPSDPAALGRPLNTLLFMKHVYCDKTPHQYS